MNGISTPLVLDASKEVAQAPRLEAALAADARHVGHLSAAPRELAPASTDADAGASVEANEKSEAAGDHGWSVDDVASGALDPERTLVATSWQTFVYRRPDFQSPKLGYLRSGTSVRRSIEPKGFGGCASGFYAIEPEGFVCVGKSASLDPRHAAARAVDRAPRRGQALPYRYASSGKSPPEQYTRLPDADQAASAGVRWGDAALRSGAPDFLVGGLASLLPNGERRIDPVSKLGRAPARSSFALVDTFEVGGEGWGLTTDLLLLPLRRLEPTELTPFRGVALGHEAGSGRTLPLAFVLERNAHSYDGDAQLGLRLGRRLMHREVILLTGEQQRIGGRTYWQTRDGGWLSEATKTVRVDPLESLPRWAKPGRTWIDVSIEKQTLVAYVGTEPVYATLVSTGKDGLADPLTTSATVQGEFLIHTKHVTHTMSSDEEGDVYEHRDVPYVQFFKDGYAFHAAHWHDGFGTPKSHGCINLSPEDARWLFDWTDPLVPASWHGAMSLLDGTLVSIHR